MANKNDLVKAVAEKLGMKIKDVEPVVDTVFVSIDEILVDGGFVNIPNHGKYETRETKERTALNLTQYTELLEQGLTKEDAKIKAAIPVPAARKPAFKPAGKLKESVK
ncbi:hypothetical protein BSK59_13045 [Paenibacillus odorifer]|uniref:HU family DNA-binding protein n=1 Tax=Paenibacillus odorifer TaxID=189426 RepID=UPI00096F31EC|nr:HU family DNA-binding protein [Paenibacillus odorifer]OME55399.1 hypothetical protein BSK59_13045 [Paenibacillus odorifer]